MSWPQLSYVAVDVSCSIPCKSGTRKNCEGEGDCADSGKRMEIMATTEVDANPATVAAMDERSIRLDTT